MPKMLRRSVSLFIALVCLLPAYAQQSFHVEHYTSQNGLPQNSVTSAQFDSSGYLWCSTEGGIVRFDGNSVQTFNNFSHPEFLTERGNSVLKTFEGDVVVQNSSIGVFAIEPGKLQQLIRPFQPGQNVTQIKGAIPGIDIYEKMVREELIGKYTGKPDRTMVSVFPLSDSSYLLIGWKDPMLFHGTVLQKIFPTGDYNPVGYFMVKGRLLFLDKENHLFEVNIKDGAITRCTLTGDLWKKAPENKTAFEYVYRTIWPFNYAFVMDGTSLYRIAVGVGKQAFTSELLTKNLPEGCLINCMACDAQRKIIAIGTDSKGLFVYRENSLRTDQFDISAAGISNVYYVQLAIDSARVMTSNQRVYNTLTGKFEQSAIGPYDNYALLKDSAGDIWYPYQNTIVRYHEVEKAKTIIPKKFTGDINTFFEDADRIWVGSQNGIGYIENDSMRLLSSLSGDPTYCFSRISDSTLMVGTGQGVYFLNSTTLKCDTLHAFDGIYVRAMQTIGDIIFIGTYGNGFYLWKGNKLVKAPIDRYGAMVDVHAFFLDRNKNIWITTNRGLFQTTQQSLQNYFSDATYPVYYYRYGVNDGMLTDEFNGGCSPAYAILANGYVSFPTIQGIVSFKPEMITALLPQEKISIDEIVVDTKVVTVSQLLNLQSDYRQLEVLFSTPYWGTGDNIWMDYKIEGRGQNWIPVKQNERRIVISNLPFGSYKLLIRKRSGFDSADWVQVILPLHVEPYFFQTSWFIGLVLLFLFGAFWLVTRLHARGMIRRNLRLEALIGVRTNELKLANRSLAVSEKNLQQSVTIKDKMIAILSHDIITPLRFIGLSAKLAKEQKQDDPQALAKTLGDIQNATVKLYDNASNILNWINLQNDRITVRSSHVPVFALVHELFEMLSELADVKDTQLLNTVSEDDIINTDPQLLSIVLTNVISNAIKHTRKGTILLLAIDEITQYKIQVIDNGEGIPKEILDRINNPSGEQLLKSGFSENDFGGSGLGYLLLRDLLPLINGSYEVKSEPLQGTSVQITIKPLN
ncbi:MAG: ATP-binding protein [Chitinophagales bacterium]